jgi:hypothetical protein
VKELLEKDAKKTSGAAGSAADKLMQDDRFNKMFQDKAFEIDKNTDAYRMLKSGNVNKRVKEADVDSVGSDDEEPAAKGRDLNKLFAGKGDEEDEEASDNSNEEDDDFQAKMSKKQRKSYKK